MMTQNETVTDEQIEVLGTEAGQHGDHAQVMICDIALGEIDADEGYDHLWIWSFLSAADQRRIRELDSQGARDICTDVILYARGEAS